MKIESKPWVISILTALLLLPFLCLAASSNIELVSDSEDIAARNSTTRIYNRTYNVTIYNQDESASDTLQETRAIVEKGDGLCYDSSLNESNATFGAPSWEPTNTNFETDSSSGWKIDKGPIKVRIATYANSTPLVSLSIPFRKKNTEGEMEKAELSLQINAGYLAWHDLATSTSVAIESAQYVSGEAVGNRILFENAFSCGDLELAYEKGSFHQNVIIRNAANLPSPALSGINASHAELRVITEITDDSITTAAAQALLDDGRGALSVVEGDAISGENSELIFKTSSEKTLCAFAPSRAWVGNDTSNARFMNKTIKVSNIDIKEFTHSEGVPYSYITENSASGAITLDYEARSSSAEASEAWQPGVTYWISDEYTIDSDQTLVIEGGAIVKFGATINIDEGNLLIKGTPFNYALFVDDDNDDVGETISNPNSNSTYYFEIHPSFTSLSEIQFAKFSDASSYAIMYQISEEPSSGDFIMKIRDSIFRCKGITMVGPSWSPNQIDITLECFNCLFAGEYNDTIYQNMWGYGDQDYHFNLYNCTFARDTFAENSQAVYLYGNSYYNASTELIVKNCLFTDYNYGMESNSSVNIAQSTSITNNGIDRTASDLLGANLSQKTSASDTSGDSDIDYFSSPNGEYYLCEPYPGKDCDCTGFIMGTDDIPTEYLDRLKKTTVFRPVNINAEEIENYNDSEFSELGYIHQQEQWTDFWSDTSPAIGFHYDIVHGVVEGLNYMTMTMTRAFDLQEGSVISFTEFSFWKFEAESNIKGNPVKRNVFNQVASTGDAIKDPRKIRDNLIPSGIGITRGTIDFSEFAFL
ncbi:hypothetical protein JW926_11920, partial [Candidatus Sumerlaeota bacterium]|nr:hypothetical protein [Candidatus Sumerlaeota bacterium]